MKFSFDKLNIKYLNFKKVKNRLGSYTSSLLLLTVLTTATTLGIRKLGALQALELIAYDSMVNLHNTNEVDPRLLIVEITDRDIERQKSFPIKDNVIAQLLANLQQHQPRVIGFDLYREVGYPPGTKALRRELQRDNVVVIQPIGNGDNSLSAPPGVAPEQIGFNDIVLDVEDDVLRRNLMYVRYLVGNEVREMSSFALRISLKYLEAKNLEFRVHDDYLQIGEAIFPDLEANSGGYQLEASETAGKQILIDYQSPKIARTITLSEALSGLPTDLIKDKIILIGTSAPSIKDIYSTPYKGASGAMPGVMAHAQMVSQILNVVLDDASLFWFWSEWLEGLWVWGWSITAAVIAWKLKHPLTIVLVGMVGSGCLWGICAATFIFSGWIPLIPAAIGYGVTIASVMGYKALYNLSYDSLTRLPNRSLFAKKIKGLKQRNRSKTSGFVAILCLDLNRFKLINDGLGYQAGDRILVEIARRLEEHFSSQAIVARVGADEFALGLKTDEETTEAIEVAKRLDRVLAIPFQLDERDIFTSASVGLALNRLNEDFQPEELLQASHTAMYQAKVSGKNLHEVYATKMHDWALKRLQLEADLNQAIINREFELYYQPIVCLRTGRVKGFEALVRWISPTRGFISPGDFIPVAEETGLIVPMGKWILATACERMQRWREQFSHAESIVMSVNLSSRQFAQADLIAQIQEALIVTDLNAASLKLEITESMVMDEVENTIILLERLKELGLKISMDDFGTGFSSFSYLHRFPVDTLKIDRSFVSNMSQGEKNREIVSTIVILAHKLGMDVIAEGIETDSERAIIQSFDCEYGQGYFFAKPLSEKEATQLLADNVRW